MYIQYDNKQYNVLMNGFIMGSFSTKRKALEFIKKELSFQHSIGIITRKAA